jgi:uncharacterized protein (TIGR04255 family)
MLKTRKYVNPPLVEIACEFRFKVADQNDLTVPGRFYEQIKPDYPIKEELQEFSVGFEFGKKEVQQKVRTKILGMQYKTQDGLDIIRVAPNLVSAHRLAPYPTWEGFFPRVKRSLQTFRGIVQPTGLERVGLRYIDRIEVPRTSFKLTEYIKFRPETPDGIGLQMSRFFMRVEFPFHDGRDVLALMVHNPAGSPAGKTWIVLDWDYVMVKPETFGLDGIPSWLEEAHAEIDRVFEATITDSSRALFEAAK